MDQPDQINNVFKALSHKTRLAILLHLKTEGEQPVGSLAERFPITSPAITQHLKILRNAGLIDRRVDRQRRLICLRPQAVDALQAWLSSLGSEGLSILPVATAASKRVDES